MLLNSKNAYSKFISLSVIYRKKSFTSFSSFTPFSSFSSFSLRPSLLFSKRPQDNKKKSEHVKSSGKKPFDDLDPNQEKYYHRNMILLGYVMIFLFSTTILKYLGFLFGKGYSENITWEEFENDFLLKNIPIRIIIDVDYGTATILPVNQTLFNNSQNTINGGNDIFAKPSLNSNNRIVFRSLKCASLDSFYNNLFNSLTNTNADLKNIELLYGRFNTSTSGPFYSMISTLNYMVSISILAYFIFSSPLRNRMPGLPFTDKVSAYLQKTNVKFSDVAGCNDAKIEIEEFSHFLKNPKKFLDLGAKIPKGAILYGPPGTGKTLIAKALANECEVPIYVATGSDFVQSFAGMGSYKVRELFKEARQNQPSIIFIDELDSIAKKRSGKSLAGIRENDSTVNQILVEMDGFNTSSQVVVIAATNRIDTIDDALLRPGRFDRKIHVSLPDIEGRCDLFKIYLSKIKLTPDLNFNNSLQNATNSDETIKKLAQTLSEMTPGFSGADISNICNEAAVLAIRDNAKSINLKHFELAIERVIAGSSTIKKISDEEKHTIAIHEAGHTIASYFGAYPMSISKISIIPRGRALGYNLFVPKDFSMLTKSQLVSQIVTLLGGRVAEELHIGRITTGAIDDLQKITKIAYSIVGVYGMDDKVIPNMCFETFNMENIPDIGTIDRYDNKVANDIDKRVLEIIKECYSECLRILKTNEKAYLSLVKALESNETLNKDQIIAILGKN